MLVVLGVTAGLSVPLQLAFNAQLTRDVQSPYIAGFFIFLIGVVAMSIVISVLRPTLPSLGTLSAMPPTVWLGGILATIYILIIVFVTPKLGVGMTTALVLVGQLMTSTLLDHFGVFGNPEDRVDPLRLFGLLLMLGGVLALKWSALFGGSEQ